MKFVVEGYRYKLDIEFTGSELRASGIVWDEARTYKFPVGTKVESRFRTHKIKAEIIRYTKTKVVLLLENGKQKVEDFISLIENNRYIELTYRIENSEGIGPFQATTTDPLFLAWKKMKCDKYRENPSRFPCPQMDDRFSKYPLTSYGAKFGTKKIEDLNHWFNEEDVSFLKNFGFSIQAKQKGADYFESLFSYTQIAIIPTEDQYNTIIKYKSEFYY